MKDRPILFSTPMVRAILGGRKTVTRRIVRDAKPLAADVTDFGGWVANDAAVLEEGVRTLRRPYGEPGDRLWVQEAHFIMLPGGYWSRVRYLADDSQASIEIDHATLEKLRAQASVQRERGRPGRFMPRWASRLELEVVDVRVERLHAIDGRDILAEGVVERGHDDPNLGRCPVSAFDGKLYPDLMSLWASGWDAINGDRAPWASNPWVWRVEFRRVEPVRAPNERRPAAPATMGVTP